MARFNETYVTKLSDADGVEYDVMDLAPQIEHPDIVAELAFRLAANTFAIGLPPAAIVDDDDPVLVSAERQAVDLVKRYEGRQPESLPILNGKERHEGKLLARRYGAVHAMFPLDANIEYCPIFPGAGLLDTCEGDLGIANTLVEVKTTTRRPSGRDVRQLLIYLALDSHARLDRWSRVAIFNPRRATIHCVDADELVAELTGGRSRTEVLGDLIALVEANDWLGEHVF